MKAVILAAGRGTRIEGVTHGLPKCLIEFDDGRTILDNQIEALWAAGVFDIAIVTGHNASCIVDHVERTFGDHLDWFTFIHNHSFATTNNIYSLWMAGRLDQRQRLPVPECRRTVPPRHSAASARHPPRFDDRGPGVARRDDEGGDSQWKCGSNEQVHLTRSEYSGTYIGITAFSRKIAPALFDEIGTMIAEGHVNEFFNAAVQRLVERGLRVGVSSTSGLPWAEIDDAADLQFARSKVYPLLPRPVVLAAPGGELLPAVA